MTMQLSAAVISFIGVAALTGAYLFVLSRSGEEAPYEGIQTRAHVVRKRLFLLLLAGFVLVPALTLRSMPYSARSDAPGAIVVDVTAHQWYWTISRAEVPVGQPVVFRVASEDVNHGFGVYAEDDRLIAQVQAMPGYVNDLALEFDAPGSYSILCLEYCGLAHHGMTGVITVVDGPAAEGRL